MNRNVALFRTPLAIAAVALALGSLPQASEACVVTSFTHVRVAAGTTVNYTLTTDPIDQWRLMLRDVTVGGPWVQIDGGHPHGAAVAIANAYAGLNVNRQYRLRVDLRCAHGGAWTIGAFITSPF